MHEYAKSKGIFWAIELVIGVLLLAGMHAALSSGINANYSIAREQARVHCGELVAVWAAGAMELEQLPALLPDERVLAAHEPFSVALNGNAVACEGFRYKNGQIEHAYALIGW